MSFLRISFLFFRSFRMCVCVCVPSGKRQWLRQEMESGERERAREGKKRWKKPQEGSMESNDRVGTRHHDSNSKTTRHLRVCPANLTLSVSLTRQPPLAHSSTRHTKVCAALAISKPQQQRRLGRAIHEDVRARRRQSKKSTTIRKRLYTKTKEAPSEMMKKGER